MNRSGTMNDDQVDAYLWDRSGPPDPTVQRLERLLEPYRFDKPIRVVVRPTVHPLRWLWYGLAFPATAAIVFAAYVALIPIAGQPGREWRVVARAGTPRVSGVAVTDVATLTAGSVLLTDAHSRAEIRAGRVGRIEVQPGSRVRLVSTSVGRHRLAVDRGRISARLWSPPFTFGFATPAADAFDVGCAFTLDVDDRGTALVRVTSGWVQLESTSGKQLIPQGMLAVAEPRRGVGTAHSDEATPGFQRALHAFDFDRLTDSERRLALATLLGDARSEDVYTLLQLVPRLTPAERGELHDRAAELHRPPAGITRDGIVKGDGPMLDMWRRSLGFPEVKRWWLHWQDAFAF
jgi:hypothetical protein